jgi:protein-S-isoprenylcysteine O-methyltransferase Ste14
MAAPGASGDRPVREALRSAVLGAAPVSILLLVPAGLVPGGTWLWPHGLWFVGAYLAVAVAGNVTLAVRRPAHFRVRQQAVIASPEKRQPRIDAVGSAVSLCFAAAWLAFVPADIFRLHLLPMPGLWFSWAGGLALVVGAALTPLAVWANKFAAPNVQDQTVAGQQIVETGVYRFVRHPIYLGNLLLFGGAALWLGSFAALVGVAFILIVTIGRIMVEEKQLRAQFPTYTDYARRVRGLIPFLL